ncbi:hypothetical protein FOZ62_019813, partial [Perkinsus olseni]
IGVGIKTNPSTGRRMMKLELREGFRRRVAAYSGVAVPTADNCMQLDLPAHSGALSLHAIRSFLGHHGFTMDKISICYTDGIGWALNFHKKDTSDEQATTALELKKVGHG